MIEQKSWHQKLWRKLLMTLVVATVTFGFFAAMPLAFGQNDVTGEVLAQEVTQEVMPEPAKIYVNQTVQLADVESGKEWKQSEGFTSSLKFLVRGREALAWAIGITDSGFDNPAIKQTYATVLTIVNSLFVLGLLAIAIMWMTKAIIPRQNLKRVILVYTLAVIFINFAFPLNRLLIDSSNLLQKTLLTRNGNPIGIVDIIETPAYASAVGYKNDSENAKTTAEKNISLSFPSFTGEPITIGTLKKDQSPIGIQGVLNGPGGGSMELQAQQGGPEKIELSSNQPLLATFTSQEQFNPNAEQEWFSIGLIALTGLAYLLMAIIFLVRIVLLWGLLILSPVLFLLAIFSFTRGYFYNWLSWYGRWLLIGPIVALGLSAMVSIWQTVGVPIASNYAGSAGEISQTISNIRFYLPGSTTPNTLSTTGQMMQYLVFLLMLYMPVFLGFALTRQKIWQSAASVVLEHGLARPPRAHLETKPPQPAESHEKEKQGVFGGIRNFVNKKFSQITAATLPKMAGMPPIPSGASFLPEQLSLASLGSILQLLGANNESRHSREQALQKLANSDAIADPEDRKNVTAAKQEIETRAANGDTEALLIQNEIRVKAESVAAQPIQIEIKEKPSEPVKDSVPNGQKTEPLKTIPDIDEDDTITNGSSEPQI